MKKDFKAYIEKLEGMDRIELILELFKEDKITIDQAVVLIANDKVVNTTPNWNNSGITYTPSINYGNTTTTPYHAYQTATSGSI